MSLKIQAHPRAWWDRGKIQGSEGLAWPLRIFTLLRPVTRGVQLAFRRQVHTGSADPWPDSKRVLGSVGPRRSTSVARHIQGLSPISDKIREAEASTGSVSHRTLRFLVLCLKETTTWWRQELCAQVAISIIVFFSKESHWGLQ